MVSVYIADPSFFANPRSSAIQCREFIKRFRNILRIPKTHVDSLDTFDSFSESTCKGLLIGLLDIIAEDEPNASAKHVSPF
jgi:hypothetical protein